MDNEKTIEQVLKEEGKLIRTTAGISMKPLFGDRRDNAIILPAVERLKKYDEIMLIKYYREEGLSWKQIDKLLYKASGYSRLKLYRAEHKN